MATPATSNFGRKNFVAPRERPTLEGLQRTEIVQFATQEYTALRGEIQTALANQAAILSFGAAAVGLLLAAGAQLWNDEVVGAGLLYLSGVPATCLLSVILFLGEQIRLTRAGYFIHTIERWVNQTQLPDVRVLGWEDWGYIRRGGGDLERRTRWVVGAVFGLLAAGAAVFGYGHVRAEQAQLALGALILTIAAAALAVGYAVRLAGWVKLYRSKYLP